MKALLGSRYEALLREVKDCQSALAALEQQRTTYAKQERDRLNGRIHDLLAPLLTDQTVNRMKLALIAHMQLSRGMLDPLLREVGQASMYGRLQRRNIRLLLEAYGDEGDYRKTPELDRALDQLFAVCHESLRTRYKHKRSAQITMAREFKCTTMLNELDEKLGLDIRLELEVFGIFTAYELSCYTREQLRERTALSDERLDVIHETLRGLGLALSE